MRDSFAGALERANNGDWSFSDLVTIVHTDDPNEEAALYRLAAAVRDRCCGRRLFVRGLVEFSNRCGNSCLYCGLNSRNTKVRRYSLSSGEILDCAGRIAAAGIGTIVLQSGEDCCPAEWLAEIIKEIKARWNLAVTLSVGERPEADYRLWRQAGADRYLLRIESSDPLLYRSLHRGRELESRIRCLSCLREQGYQLGSGIMVGLPGQSAETIAKDVEFFEHWDFDMIGIGPFIPHPDTELHAEAAGGIGRTLNTIALTRILLRNSLMPATTALGSLEGDHRLQGLNAGANVIMPNFTPDGRRSLYSIYPGKNCCNEFASGDKPGVQHADSSSASECRSDGAVGLAEKAGLSLDMGRGDSLKKKYQHI